MSADKAALRKMLRGHRRALPAAAHALLSGRAARAISRLRWFAAGARVAVYVPFDREVDTAPLVAAARRRGVRLFVPVVTDLRHRRMRFYPFGGPMRRGAYGIPVPRRASPPIDARWLDLIVVPLVGVDDRGRRLGMGAGYYDRAIAFRRLRDRWRGPRLIGLAFDCQRVPSIAAQTWDLGVDLLATESGLCRFRRNCA